MSRIQIDGVQSTSAGLQSIPLRRPAQGLSSASGALGTRLDGRVKNAADAAADTAKHVSQLQAEAALQQLLGQGPAGTQIPTLSDVMEMDPMVLSIMMTQLVLNVSGNNAQLLCQQLERATDVQATLRNKQVAEYQAQINKAVDQTNQARKSGILTAIFDWILGGVEAIVGVIKMVEGVLTADPLAVADGAAYLSAGMAGMVKAGAETALLLGADKETCNEVINVAGKVQSSCEGVALAMDVMQIGRGVSAARAVAKATEELLESGIGKQLVEAIGKGAEDELQVLAEKVGQEVSRVLGQDFGMAVEREMIEVGDMAIEAAEHAIEAEGNMVRRMGTSFTRAGVEALVKTAIEAAGKDLLKQGAEIVGQKLRDAILQKLRRSIVSTVIRDCTSKLLTLTATRAMVGGVEKISSGVVAIKTAQLQREIEQLIVQQGFIDFAENWTGDCKKTQQKQLNDTYLQAADAMKCAAEIIDNCGTALANIAGARA